MSAAVQRPMTRDEFLAWEERQELRYEFDGIRPIAMNGGTFGHGILQYNLALAVGPKLRGNCRFLGPGMKVEIGEKFRYPDGFVVCAPIDRRALSTSAPVVIFEILSPSTAAVDRIIKNEEYQTLPSVRRYVMLEQDRIAATVFARDGEDWVGHLLTRAAMLSMPEIGIELPLAQLYESIDLDTVEGSSLA